ncbi:hypothetical protein AALP_AA7G221500 [Arabis alpina]|uniref:Leucine-rich repeat-containing N-terminal plant-type domain-containing protein n=1 Tax=Arabis alpina TaxID=50452 RepID=A0A087GJT3_ARAAL|nr:hypothetical protein AALP_AA7G221500 [Arabis alpina]
MSGLRLRLGFLLVLLLCCVSASSVVTYGSAAACGLSQIQAFTQFKSEFNSRGCNQTNYFNGVCCDNTTGAVTALQVPSGCLSGTLNPNSSLFRFHHLRYLSVSYNYSTSSSIPSGLGNLVIFPNP